jgi:UDP-N-acetyl-2-amino-2-deoxyglucuronate dehydrogenase
MHRELRFAVIGCGVIGATHVEAIASIPDARLVAVADTLPERANALAERAHCQAYPSAAELLATENIDIVCICTPSGLHAAPACAAMRAGCHVLVEKPIETTLPKIDKMLHVQAETGVKLGCVFQHRFDPASVQLHDLVTEGAFGRLILGTAQLLWWRSQGYYDSGAWRGTIELDGGGVLMNQTIHTIDLLLWNMGRAETVTAYMGTLAHAMQTEDTAVASIRFASGALGTVIGTTAAYPGVATRLELLGDRGSAVVQNDVLTFLHLARDDAHKVGDYGLAPTTPDPISPAGPLSQPSTTTILDDNDASEGTVPLSPHDAETAARSPSANNTETSARSPSANNTETAALSLSVDGVGTAALSLSARAQGFPPDTSAGAHLGLQAHAAQIADMIAAVRDDRPPLIDGLAARAPVELILAIYESARTGREVVLP